MLKKAWSWLSGKKTIIGSLAVAFLGLDLDFMQKIPADITTIAYWLFGLLAAGGLLHKGVKAINKNKPNNEK